MTRMGTKTPAMAVWAIAGLVSISGCQCGEGAGTRERGGEVGEGEEKGTGDNGEGEEAVRLVVSEREVRLDRLTVGDVKELAKEPYGGELKELGRALGARIQRGEAEKILLVAEAKVPAPVVRRAVATAWNEGVKELVFVLGGKGGRRLEVKPPVEREGALEVTLARGETQVRSADGKTWTIPNAGPARDHKVLGDVLYSRKEDPELQDRDDIDIVIEVGARYGELFLVLESAAAGGFDRPRLLASTPE